MTIIAAVEKGSELCIAADTQTNFGSLRATNKYLRSCDKIFGVGESFIGLCGWSATTQVFEHLINVSPEKFKLESRMTIFETLLALQNTIANDYFVESKEEDDQPVDSNQIDGLIINKSGIFRIGSYREVHHHSRFWAVGTGQKYALGAMHALYEANASAQEIAVAGARAAVEFDDSCGADIQYKIIQTTEGARPGVEAEAGDMFDTQ